MYVWLLFAYALLSLLLLFVFSTVFGEIKGLCINDISLPVKFTPAICSMVTNNNNNHNNNNNQ